jgi:hypothetical protein
MKDIPKKYIRVYNKAMTGRSRKSAMKAFCQMCVSYQNGEIEKCTDTQCPLYPYRLK